MLHRKNMKLKNKIMTGLVVGVIVASFSVTAKPKSENSTISGTPKKFDPNKALSAEDKKFVELREASKANEPSKAISLAKQLGSHDLRDYVSYFQIKPQLYDKANQAKSDATADVLVVDFLNQYEGTAIADRLRNDWLLVLGKRQDWKNFDRQYPLFKLDDDTQVKCYSFQSRMVKDEDVKIIASEAKNVLWDPKFFGDACADLVSSLYKEGGLVEMIQLPIS